MEIKKLNGFEYFLLGFKKYAVFKGRSTRSELWYFILFSNLFILGFFLFVYFLHIYVGIFVLFVVLYMLATIVPTIALFVRRFHDIKIGNNAAIPFVIWFAITITLFVAGWKMIDNNNDIFYGLLSYGLVIFSAILFFVGFSPFPLIFLALFNKSATEENKYDLNSKEAITSSGASFSETPPSPMQ